MKKPFLFTALVTVSLVRPLPADTVVVFNEIMYHPATTESAREWVEFYNQLAVDVDISGWSVTGGIDYTFPSNTIVRGGGYLLLALSPATVIAETGSTNVFGPFTGRLSNNGDQLRLRNNSGRLMDEVNYGVEDNWPVAPDGAGVSLAKRDRTTASGPAANWAASAQVGGTPRAQNFAQQTGFVAPPGLVSYWPFNETSGTAAMDEAGQNHGTLGSGVTHAGGAGIGGALSFNGATNAYVNVGPGAGNNFSVTNGLSLEAVLSPGWSGTNAAVIFRKAVRRPGAYSDTVLTNQPLAYWRLNDSTTTIQDSTLYGHNGTAGAGVQLNQSSLIPSDPGNSAVRVTGANRIIVNGFEKIGPRGYTVEFWVKPDLLPTLCCQNLVGDGETGDDFFMMNYILGPQQGLVGAIRPHYSFANSPVSLASPTALQVGRTYHIVTTWDATSAANNALIYINGVADLVGTVTQNVPAVGTTGANRVYIGYDDRGTTDGNNTIDEVALYNYPLSAAEVAAHYLSGTATNFDLDLGNAIQLAFQNDGNNAQANPPVATGPVLSFGLTLGGIYSELDMPLDGQAGRPTLAGLEDGQLHHVVATYDSATGLKAIYVDGVLGFSTTLSGALNANNGANAVLGNGEVNGSTPFVGLLDEMTYWSRALNASEILAHASAMQAGRGYFASTSQVAVTTLAFNEQSASTNAEFWIELMNYGTEPARLDGCVIYYDGVAPGQYVFPTNGLSLAPGGSLVLTNGTLGFFPTSGEKLYLFGPTRTNVLDSLVVKKAPRARYPDGTGEWLRPSAPTPGAANTFTFHDEVVINEIMYHHSLLPATNNLPPLESPEAWIELYNQSTNTVNLTGWELAGGVSYPFTPGQTIAPGGYLVVADNAAALRLLYPAAPIVGNFGGRLSGKSDRILLKDPAGNPADEVRYFDGGAWPSYADGGGSSLELRDPKSDNAKAEAWAASDETGKTSWQTYSYRMVANVPSGSGQPSQWNDFIFGLLSGGECLIDDISVVESPTNAPVPFIANGNFENGLTGWRVLGTHGDSRVEVDPDNPGNHVLHLVATGPQEHMHNHIETTYINSRTVVNTRLYEISFRARWLAGNNLLNTRLYFNRVARSTALPMPSLNGTPGARNSRFEPNIGPTFSELQHRAVVPKPDEPVTVSVVAHDPQGVASARLFWSVNSGAWNSAALSSAGDGHYTGSIPGQASGAVVQFYVQATDGLGATANFPARGPDSGALYKVEDGQANLALAHNVRIILTPTNIYLLHGPAQRNNQTNVMSNELLPCTVVYDEQRAYYECGVHLRGSQRGRYSDVRTGFHINFPPDDLFNGVHPVMLIDRSGAGDSTANKQEEIVLKHMLTRAGGLPGTYSEICRVLAPRSAHTGPAQWWPRHEDLFIETAFENGGDGTMFEMELIYYPTTTTNFGYKLPWPDGVVGTDFTDLGNDKEIYRYNFMLKNHRDADDYSRFITFCKTLSLPTTTPALQAQLQAEAEQVLDVDQWMRAYAFVSLCSVGDMYTYGNNHNWFMYQRPSDGKFLYFPWDMDFVFTRGSSGALVGDQNLAKLVNLTPNLRRLYGHMLDILNVSFNSSYMTYWTDHYDNFAPGQNYSGTLNNIGLRATFVRSTINGAGGNAPFAVTGTNFIVTTNNLITFSGTAPVQVKTIKVNGQDYPVTWTTISAWTLRLTVSAPSNELNLVAYDLRGNPLTNFSRTVTVLYSGGFFEPAGNVVISEVMFQPAVSNAAYVELQNMRPDYAFDLSGWRFQGLDYNFPSGTVLPPKSFVVLAKNRAAFATAYGTSTNVFAEFEGRLDPDGETLTLVKPGATPVQDLVVDQLRFEPGLPWPTAAGGQGAAIQVVDGTVDNARVSDWSDGSGWRFYSLTGTLQYNATNFYIWMGGVGDVYLDDVRLMHGSTPGLETNFLQNGDFESPFENGWSFLGTNLTNSAISTDLAHSGNASLHVVSASAGGTSRAIVQTLPLPPTNLTCTLSYWYYANPNGTNLIVRTYPGSSLNSSVNVRPVGFTPGAANSVAASLPPYPELWLNEAQPDNVRGATDRFGEHDAWIELYNRGTNVIDLSSVFLASQYTNLTQWQFPAGAVIQPGQFLVVWADGEPGESDASEWHTSFALSHATGTIVLARLLGGQPQILDYFNYTAVGPDQSYGSYPDGQPFHRRVFDIVTPGAPNLVPPVTVFLNEWVADNVAGPGGLTDPADGRYDDWFEIYNPGSEPANLGDFYLTDNLANPRQWRIPDGTVIPAGGYLLVWADGDTAQNGSGTNGDVHANFKLEKNGEALGLFAVVGTNLVQVDAVTFGAQFSNISEGRYPDGAGHFDYMPTPTPRAANLPGNSLPVLAPLSDLTVAAEQLIRFTVDATDPDAPPQVLTFTLEGTPPFGATLDAATGLFEWTPTADQALGTNFLTVRVTDNGIPNLSARATFRVIVLASPRVVIQPPVDGVVSMTFGTQVGKHYRVECKDDLNAPAWTTLQDDLLATGSSLTITDPVGDRPQRFYQIVLLD